MTFEVNLFTYGLILMVMAGLSWIVTRWFGQSEIRKIRDQRKALQDVLLEIDKAHKLYEERKELTEKLLQVVEERRAIVKEHREGLDERKDQADARYQEAETMLATVNEAIDFVERRIDELEHGGRRPGPTPKKKKYYREYAMKVIQGEYETDMAAAEVLKREHSAVFESTELDSVRKGITREKQGLN